MGKSTGMNPQAARGLANSRNLKSAFHAAAGDGG